MKGKYMTGKIYKLCSEKTTDIYVGSTILSLHQRFLSHKGHYKRYLNKEGNYMSSFELLKHGDVKIKLIEDYPCASKKELETRERDCIKTLKQEIVCVNKILPGQKNGGNYQNGKIYKLVSEITNMIYIGSTIRTLNIRFSCHKSDYRRYINKKGPYVTSFELLQHEDVKIVLIENYSCASKKELETKEREWIEKYDCVNKFVPGRTRKEHYEDNKVKIKEFNQVHKVKIKEQRAKYYEKHKDKIKKENAKYREEHKDKIKERDAKKYQKHKDKIKKENAKYREEHKDKIKERDAKPFYCECGSTVTTGGRYQHLNTKKHKEFIATHSKE